MRIRTKVLLAFLLAILTTGTTAVLVTNTVAEDIITQQVNNHLETTAQSRARHIDTYLLSEKQRVEQLSESVVTKNLLATSLGSPDYDYKLALVTRRARSTAAGSQFAYDVFVLDPSGTIVASDNPEKVGLDKSEDSLFTGGKEGTSIKGPMLPGDTKLPSLSFSAPVLDDASGAFLGVVAMRMSMGALNAICKDRTGLGSTGETYLLNHDGFMLTPSRFMEETFLTQKIETAVIEEHRAASEEPGGQPDKMASHVYEDYMGRDVLGTHAHIMEADWILVVEKGADEAFRPVTVLASAVLRVFVVLLLLGVVVGILLPRYVSRPLMTLHRGVEELAKGNLGHRVGTSARDEIGELSRAFDTMSVNLLESREQLEQYSRGLESMVAQRTEELTKTNTELSQEIERRKEAEEAREALIEDLRRINERLDASNKELEDFAYVASHDLREPLRKISSFGSILADTLKGKLNEDEEENFGFMVDGAQRMQAMIDALLTYSRVTTKAKAAERVDLNDVVAGLQELEVATMLEETDGSMRVPGSLPVVHGDPSQIRQLFQNLVANGLKFHRDGIPPEITITSRETEAGMVRIEVKDNGIGIPAEYLEQVFTMFKRLHSRARYEGTGIGLAVCKKIVERNGGRIGIESAPGEGSTFWLTLPSRVGEEENERKE